MKCKYTKLLNKYLDNELSVRDYKFVNEHLSSCPICSTEIKGMILLKEDFIKNKIDTNAEFFWQQVKSRLAKETYLTRGEAFVLDFGNWSKRFIPLPVAVGLIAAIFLSVNPGAKENLVDKYIFGNTNGSAYSLIEESGGNQSRQSLLLY